MLQQAARRIVSGPRIGLRPHARRQVPDPKAGYSQAEMQPGSAFKTSEMEETQDIGIHVKEHRWPIVNCR